METKKCIYCGMDVEKDAARCQYCGSILEVHDSGKEKDSNVENTDNQQQLSFLPSETVISSNPNEPGIEPLSNAMKVFLTALTALIPGIGQIIGIIVSLVLMNTARDADRKSFGKALLITSLLVFVIACMACFAVVIVAASLRKI